VKKKSIWQNLVGTVVLVISLLLIIGCSNPIADDNASKIPEGVTITIPVGNEGNQGDTARVVSELLFPHFKLQLDRVDSNRVKVTFTNVTSTATASVTYRLKIEKNGILQYNRMQSMTGVEPWSGNQAITTYIPGWTRAIISEIVATQSGTVYPMYGTYEEY
jgi:hypothetical protein